MKRKKSIKVICVIAILSAMFTGCSHHYKSDIMDLTFYQWNLWPDKDAVWEDDTLYLPPVDVSGLPVNPPTIGWDALHRGAGKLVRIPATVEEYFWGENGHPFGISGNYAGVSWFTTRFSLPKEWAGKRIVLKFESVRLRAEVYLNEELVGYDIINGTPFEVDVTDKINYSLDNNLAVRITDPNGNFDWRDYLLYRWGEVDIAPSHGFGGITGKVWVQASDSIYINDLYIKNRPDVTSVDIEVAMKNMTEQHTSGELSYSLIESSTGKILSSQSDHQELFLGEETFYTTISLPDARIWSPDSPSLYELEVVWSGTDGSVSSKREHFGFRWFEVRDIDGDRQFYLNNKRIVLRSAISWGHWPVNGIIPTAEMAEKQVSDAKQLGLNMLNFHRGIGQTVVLDEADRQGLLYYEEPGGYNPQNSDFSKAFKREKLLRMIRRDRNHPSLIIYSMINEAVRDPYPNEMQDMLDAHGLDQTRMITFTSTNFRSEFYNGKCPMGPAPVKMHMLPNDDSVYIYGYWDEHHAGGPGVYLDQFYGGPENIFRNYDNPGEIIFLGEEGAIGTPPRLERIAREIDETDKNGWDGDQYLAQGKAFEKFLKKKGFENAFPTLDDLTTSFGEVAYYYQGRIIENFRIGNTGDGYVINGWEATKVENHSGIVDNYRNLKADPSIMAYYNRPLYVAVKLRNKVVGSGDSVTVDFYIVNELDLKGKYFLRVTTKDEFGMLEEAGFNIEVTGGNRYGELLVRDVTFMPQNPGYFTVIAELYDGDKLVADGKDRAYMVSYEPQDFKVPVAVLDTSGFMQDVLCKSGISRYVEYGSFNYPQEKVLLLGGDIQPGTISPSYPMREPLIEWVTRGNTLVITRNPEVWADYLDYREVMDYRGYREIGRVWYGGNYFVREHPLFEGLPVNTAFNWEYQCLAQYYDRHRVGLRLKGDECVVGCYADHNREVYSALSVIRVGEGQIILSALDLTAAIQEGSKASVVASKILLNMIEYSLDADDYLEAEDNL